MAELGRGNASTPFIALRKACVDFLFVVIELFSLSYGLDVISGNLSRSAFFEGCGSL